MTLLGGLLPGLLSSINPANILRGAVNVGTGILDNISKGAPIDFSGNLSRGLKTAFGDTLPALGSIGGNNTIEPTIGDKMMGTRSASNMMGMTRMNDMNRDLNKSISKNAANLRGVYSEDRTRTMTARKHPVNEMVSIGNSVESAPAGMPDRRIAIAHSTPSASTGGERVPKAKLLNARDQFGYKSVPVEMTGVKNDLVIPQLNLRKERMRVRKGKVGRRKPMIQNILSV